MDNYRFRRILPGATMYRHVYMIIYRQYWTFVYGSTIVYYNMCAFTHPMTNNVLYFFRWCCFGKNKLLLQTCARICVSLCGSAMAVEWRSAE